MPRSDPIPTPRTSTARQFRRLMKRMALLSLVAAVVAIMLVARGSDRIHIHMLIATGVGVGLMVLLATALMSLVFLSASSGHDADAAQPHERGPT